MQLELTRKWKRGESILGIMMHATVGLGYTLEHPCRDPKIPGITGIPAGEYIIKPRREGEMYKHYCERFKCDHPMLWLQDVPDFQYVYIHILNKVSESKACIGIGVGYGHEEDDYRINASEKAYLELHKKIMAAWERGEEVKIKIIDLIAQLKKGKK
jgi:hypothetical protein